MNRLFAPPIVGPSLWMDGTLDHKTSLKNVEGIRRFHDQAKPGSGVATVKSPDGKVLQKLRGDITIDGSEGSGYQVTVEQPDGRGSKTINLHSATDGKVSIGHIGGGPNPDNNDRGPRRSVNSAYAARNGHTDTSTINLTQQLDVETARRLSLLDYQEVTIDLKDRSDREFSGTGTLILDTVNSNPAQGYVRFSVAGLTDRDLWSDDLSGTITPSTGN